MNIDNATLNETDLQTAVEIVAGGKKNVIMDATILSTLMSCPRLFDFRFNHNFESIGGKSNSLEVGSVVHKFLEIYYGSIIAGVSKTQAAGFAYAAAQLYISGCPHCTDFEPINCSRCVNGLIEVGDELSNAEVKCDNCGGTGLIGKPKCGHQPNEYPGVSNTPEESSGYMVGWKHALATCDEYLDYYKNDHWVPLEVERVRGNVLYEDDEVRILWKAKLDLVVDTNQGIYSVDHKTMKQNRDMVKLNNQFIGQCLLMGTRVTIINRIGFQKTLPVEKRFGREPISYSADVLFEWQSEILPYYAKSLLMYVEMGYFPPNFTHCDSKFGKCSFLNVCSANPNMREEELRIGFKIGHTWDPTNADD